MDSRTPIENMALPLPKASQMVKLDPPRPGVHGGVSIKDATHEYGFEFTLLAHQGQEKGANVALYVNDMFVDDATIPDINADIIIPTPPDWFNKGLNTVYFLVTRQSDNAEKTPTLTLAYTPLFPGDFPPELNLGLNLGSVDQSNADALVATAQYANMNWYDWIYIFCNGVLVSHRLVPNGDPNTTPVPAKVNIPITREVLRQGGDDQTFEFKFRVMDNFTNKSGPPTWSGSQFIPVNLTRSFLQPGVLKENLSDNNDNPATIERSKLEGGPLWYLVHLVDSIWRAGDVLKFQYTAEKDGRIVASHSDKLPVSHVPTQLIGSIPNEKVVAGSIVTVVHQQEREGEIIGNSKPAAAQVVAEDVVEPAAAPVVVEAPDKILDANVHQKGFTARVVTLKYPTATIELVVHGRPGDGSTVPVSKSVNGQPHLDFPITATITGANQGESVEISYNVLGLGQPIPSEVLDLNITKLLQSSMPQPEIAGFTQSDLNITQIKDDARVICGTWPFQRSGLPIWLSYEEHRVDGSKRSKDQFVGTPHEQGAGLNYPAEVLWLRQCKAESKLTIELKAGLYTGAQLNDAVACQDRVYTVKQGLDDLTTFNGFDWNQWTLYSAHLSKITILDGEYYLESQLHANGRHLIYLQKIFDNIEIEKGYRLSFDYIDHYGTDLIVTQNGVTVYNSRLLASTTWHSKSVSFISGPAPTASPMVLVFHIGGTPSPVKLDNLRLSKI